MDIPRIASPSLGRVLDPMSYHDRRPSASRSHSHSSVSSHSSRAPMTIPHNRPAEAPPPLPPPRFIEDLANGHDLGWRWGNSVDDERFEKLPPINQSSSLHGGYRRQLVNTIQDEEAAEEMDVDGEFDRRGSTVSTIRSPSHPEVFPGSLGYIYSGGKRTPSPSATSNQRLVHSAVLAAGAASYPFILPEDYAALRHNVLPLSYAQPQPPRAIEHSIADRVSYSDYKARNLWRKKTLVDPHMHMTSMSFLRLGKAARRLDKRAWALQTSQYRLREYQTATMFSVYR